jgi:hypothetical protein
MLLLPPPQEQQQQLHARSSSAAPRSGATTSEPLLSGILILSLSPLVLLPRATAFTTIQSNYETETQY